MEGKNYYNITDKTIICFLTVVYSRKLYIHCIQYTVHCVQYSRDSRFISNLHKILYEAAHEGQGKKQQLVFGQSTIELLYTVVQKV